MRASIEDPTPTPTPTPTPLNQSEVAGLSLSKWTELFWIWLFQTTDEANPFTTVGPARPWRYAGRQPTEFQRECQDKYGEAVWFVSTAPYAEPGSIIRMELPVGNWSLLVAPAIDIASTEMFPSLDTIEKLREHVHNDVRSTYELWTIFDGFSVPWYYIDNTEHFIQIENVPTKNKNFLHQELPDVVNTLQAGYWNLIKPDKVGDHILTIHSKSPVYHVDVTYQITIPGPAASV